MSLPDNRTEHSPKTVHLKTVAVNCETREPDGQNVHKTMYISRYSERPSLYISVDELKNKLGKGNDLLFMINKAHLERDSKLLNVLFLDLLPR